ncbi:ion transporter [Novipirellula artificiosorum]|uniref:Cyclic nucleotide-gated potassium channel n=1 Tax=Novipirellula artificiosorum TaxID=2528016 RepID=A0A5C6DKE0_9BACT|nr:ion transporter [Novipirellula artificiosorum]TWU37228.1 Cyclic nucleotide-gated potassium channel [Novipirellula artificiosorum]
MTSLRSVIEESDTPSGKAFDFAIQGLIVLSLVTFSIETMPGLSPSWVKILRVFEVITVAIFTVEYVIRFWLAKNKISFATSFFGLVDLIAILPFYLSLGIDLRSVRSFRLLRVFRIMKLGRYSVAVQRFHRAFIIAREELVLFFFSTLIMLFIASVGIYHFEHTAQPEAFASVFHSLWWAVTTLTTVGYGDIYPITVGGRFFTFLVLLVGLGIVSVPAGLVASALSEARKLEEK